MKKLIQILLLLLPLFTFGQTPRVFTGKCNISQTGSGSGYWTVSIAQFNDPLGLYDASEIQVNDKLLFNDGGIEYVLNITLVSSAVGNSATVRVSNVGITGISSVPTFTGASITRGTTNYGFIPIVANISDNNQQGNQEYNMYRVDSILAIKDSTNVIPLSDPITFGGVVADTVQEALEAIDARLDSAMIDTSYVRNDSVFIVEGGEEIFTGNSVAEPSQQVAYGNTGGNGLTSSSTFVKEATRVTINNGTTSANIGFDRIPTPAATLPKGTSVSLIESAVYALGARRTISRIETKYNAWGNDRYADMQIGIGTQGATYGAPSLRIFSDSALGSSIKPVILGWNVNLLPATEISSHVTILGRSATENTFEVADYTTLVKDLSLEVATIGSIKTRKYGLGNMEAQDILKTKSTYSARFATDGTIIEERIDNGIYIPTITKNTATDTIVTVYTAMYSRNDSICNISGQILLNTAAATVTSAIQLSLPPGITSNFTDADNDISGTVTTRTKTSPRITTAAWATVDTSTDKIVLNWDADGGTGIQQYLSFNLNLRIR